MQLKYKFLAQWYLIVNTSLLTLQGSGAPRGRNPPFGTKNQHNFVDIMQFVTLCYDYFSRNNLSSCC